MIKWQSCFDRNKSTISRYFKNIFEEGELEKGSVVANFATTASDEKTYHVDYYNLDANISVRYFKELLNRIRDIRALEKVFYHQILEIYSTSVDCNSSTEIIYTRVDA